MLKDELFKKSIYSGIISSIIFLVFFQPIINYSGNFLFSMFTKMSNSFSNSMYKNAALGVRNWVSVLQYLFLSGLFVGITVGILIFFLFGNRLMNHKEGKNNSKPTVLKKSAGVIWIISSVFTLYNLISTTVNAYSDLQLNTYFQQRLTIIAPHIDEEEEEKIKAKWAMMKNKNDYNNINRYVDDIAKKNKITIPKPF